MNGLVPVDRRVVPPETGTQSRLSPRAQTIGGVLWCVAGGVVMSMATPLGTMLVAVGSCLLAGTKGRSGVLASVAVALAATLVTAFVTDDLPFDLVACAACGLAFGCLYGLGRMTWGKGCAVFAATSVALLVIDAVMMWANGLNLGTYITDAVGELFSSIDASASVDLASQLKVFENAFDVLWPSAYTVVAFACVVCAALGARVALRDAGMAGRALPFREFDLPLWVGYCLLAGIVGLVVASTVSVAQDAVLVVSANVLMGVRMVLAVEGVAVLVWLLDGHAVGGLLRGLALVAAVVLDVQFFVMAIVGLIDVWANFRHLNRGGGAPQRES